MKIAICEDFAEDRKKLLQYCEETDEHDISLFSSGEDLLNSPDLSSLNLLFLDIEMEQQDGIQVMKSLEFSNPFTMIAFCTSHQEMMPDAFGRNVISFLSKPIQKHSVEQCIHKTKYLIREFAPIEVDDNIQIPCKDILYLHSEQKYTIFYTTDGNYFLSHIPLKQWAEDLTELGFCAISRYHIINLKYFLKLIHQTVMIAGGKRLPVSRRHLPQLKSQADSYTLRTLRYAAPHPVKSFKEKQ